MHCFETVLQLALLASPLAAFIVPIKPRINFERRSRIAAALNKETLTFSADFAFVSEPFFVADRSDVISFFKKDETRDLLLSAGGKRSAEAVTLTPELIEMWKICCNTFYGPESLPGENDIAIAAVSDIQFPGLKMITTVCSGSKALSTRSNEDLPMYEFVLIADKFEVQGAAPVVWIFNKLTGSKAEDSQEFGLTKTRARSRVSLIETENSNYAFQFALEMQVKVEFPKVLVKIMPTTKEKMEEQGSNAILKAVKQDIIDAITETRNSFVSTHESCVAEV